MAPQIKEYTAQTDVLRPSETGIEALAGAGFRAGRFYNQAAETLRQGAQDVARSQMAIAGAKEGEARAFGDVGKSFGELGAQAETAYAHHEISQGAATFASLHSELTDAWNDTAKNADPNDTSISGKFRDTVLEPKLDEFRQAFSTEQGQQWAEGHIAALRDHMVEKASADMSTLAGDAVAVNVTKTTNAWANTARNDPSAVPFLMATADSSIAGIVSSSPNLKGADAARAHSQLTQKAKEDIVRAGALGAIEKSGDPDAAAAAIVKRYPEYIKPGEADQLAKAAKTFRLAASADSERARRLAKEQADAKSADLRDNKYIPDITGDNPQVTRKDILMDHSLTWEDRTRLLGVINKADKVSEDDPVVKTLLGGSLHDPNVSLSDARAAIMQAQIDGQLTPQTATTMRQLSQELESGPIKEPIYQKMMADAARVIGTDDIGKERFADFQLAFMKQYLDQKRAGTLPPDALDVSNPDSMIFKAMKPYTRTPEQKLQDKISRGFTVAPEDVPAPVKVATPAEALALKPGTRYIAPDGQVRVR